jgi:hypothetical protein
VGEALIVNEVVRDPDTDGVTDKELLLLGLKLDDTLDVPLDVIEVEELRVGKVLPLGAGDEEGLAEKGPEKLAALVSEGFSVRETVSDDVTQDDCEAEPDTEGETLTEEQSDLLKVVVKDALAE